MSVIKAQI